MCAHHAKDCPKTTLSHGGGGIKATSEKICAGSLENFWSKISHKNFVKILVENQSQKLWKFWSKISNKYFGKFWSKISHKNFEKFWSKISHKNFENFGRESVTKILVENQSQKKFWSNFQLTGATVPFFCQLTTYNLQILGSDREFLEVIAARPSNPLFFSKISRI